MKMVLRGFLVLLHFMITSGASAQGYLMLAGGAAESQGGWSDTPYGWVVEHASNKRIAVISYNSGQTDWIPDYFKSLGALEARNITIADRITANEQSTYDTLISYDGIFLKGGDQSIYYERYRGTKTEEALQYIYNQGGVLSGTSAGTAILSPIVFTAQVASVDPGQALLNAYSSQMTLADDFLETLAGIYIFDTHFIERGRFGRLPAFMASWYKNTGQIGIGIGIDDHTAFCIDPDLRSVVYGTGAVSLMYNRDSVQPYDTSLKMLRAKNMELVQLLHGVSIDLKDDLISGFNDVTRPAIEEEYGRYSFLLSGTEYPSDTAYQYFVNGVGSREDSILIVTGSSLERAREVKYRLESSGAAGVSILQALPDFGNDPDVQRQITESGKFFIIGNVYHDLMRFLNWTNNGALLIDALKQPFHSSFFAGDNARFAGKTVIEKYMGSGFSSYQGNMEFLPGLGLLETTALMPNTFIYSEFYENTVSGLPFAMISGGLRYGLYLTGNSFVEYGVDPDQNSYLRNLAGSYPMILLENEGTATGFANQGPYERSRNIVGFESMKLRFLAVSDSVILGKNVPLAMQGVSRNECIHIYPNPADQFMVIESLAGHSLVIVYDMFGRVQIEEYCQERIHFNLEYWANGPYLLCVLDAENLSLKYKQTIIITHSQ